jgi:predicted signal transduction protein with EAL and GGDEF domain
MPSESGLVLSPGQDSLTGLANRRALLRALTAAIASPPADGSKHAFFLIDLNDFKRVNDPPRSLARGSGRLYPPSFLRLSIPPAS